MDKWLIPFSLDKLPDLTQAFYLANTPCELWRLIEDAFRNTDVFSLVEIANQMHLMIRILNDKNNIHVLNSFFKELAIYASELEREFKVPIRIEKRQKSIDSIIKKLLQYVIKGDSPYKINDVFGFRFIIGNETKDTSETVKKLYAIANETMPWLVMRKKCIPIIADSQPDDSCVEKAQSKGIYVPSESLLDEVLRKYYKDYVSLPKSTTYQAAHCSFEIPTNQVPRGVPCELQFRTNTMHIRAEGNGLASHSSHKAGKYADVPEIFPPDDRGKLHISGFSPESDEIGLFDSVKDFRGLPS